MDLRDGNEGARVRRLHSHFSGEESSSAYVPWERTILVDFEPLTFSLLNFILNLSLLALGIWMLRGHLKLDRPSRICRLGGGLGFAGSSMTHFFDWIDLAAVGLLFNIVGIIGWGILIIGLMLLAVRLGNRPF